MKNSKENNNDDDIERDYMKRITMSQYGAEFRVSDRIKFISPASKHNRPKLLINNISVELTREELSVLSHTVYAEKMKEDLLKKFFNFGGK